MKSLLPAVQTYAWGKVGSDSEVYKLFSESGNANLDPSKPYAELWMGTHPSGPSKIRTSDGNEILLKDFIHGHPEVLGDGVRRQFGDNLPFLFKVLSVNKALSIQAHPNKSHAAELHKAKPEIYKDANHKPEMAIALTPFEALCGFRPLDEVVGFLQSLPELNDLIGPDVVNELMCGSDKMVAMANCFRALMTCSAERVESQLASTLSRLESMPDRGEQLMGSLLRRLNEQFPNDVGCFCIYFMNYVVLQPGEAMFLEANLIHAYLYGDCIECMACSDNVVRAGLTPKFKDVETLCSMLNYERMTPKQTLFKPWRVNANLVEYSPNIPDFAVQMIESPPGNCFDLPAVPSASLVLVVQGGGNLVSTTGDDRVDLIRGRVVFIDANSPLRLEVTSQTPFLAFRAYTDVK